MVREIRDKATRRRLAVLPYELRFKEPFPEYVRLGECPGAAVAGTPGRVETVLPWYQSVLVLETDTSACAPGFITQALSFTVKRD